MQYMNDIIKRKIGFLVFVIWIMIVIFFFFKAVILPKLELLFK